MDLEANFGIPPDDVFDVVPPYPVELFWHAEQYQGRRDAVGLGRGVSLRYRRWRREGIPVGRHVVDEALEVVGPVRRRSSRCGAIGCRIRNVSRRCIQCVSSRPVEGTSLLGIIPDPQKMICRVVVGTGYFMSPVGFEEDGFELHRELSQEEDECV